MGNLILILCGVGIFYANKTMPSGLFQMRTVDLLWVIELPPGASTDRVFAVQEQL